MRKCPQIAEKEPSLSADDGDECSSYGTETYSQGFLEDCHVAVPTIMGDGLASLNAAIATFSKGQAIVVEKLSLLEKIVGTVQFDMTWVRDDMKGVHHAMEKMSNHVCDLQAATTEVERFKEQVLVDANAMDTWERQGHAQDIRKAPSVSNSHGEQLCGNDAVPYCNTGLNEVGSYIEETQAFENNVETYMNRMSPVGGPREREWRHANVLSPELGSPPCQQTRARIVEEPLEEESQYIEMSCQSSQLQTQVPGQSMWADFTAAVRDWQAPTPAENGREKGWVTTKKGRWDAMDYRKDRATTTITPEVEGHGALNLNLPPEKQNTPAAAWVSGGNAPSSSNVGASKKGGIETARGTARPKRPPAVEPRFHTPVSGAQTNI